MTSQKINPKVVWVAALGGFITLLAPSLVEHLQQWESGKARVLVVYPDKLANNIPTVCNGLTRHVTRTPIIVGERWSEEKCVVEEANAIERVQRDLIPCFKILPPPSVLTWPPATPGTWAPPAPAAVVPWSPGTGANGRAAASASAAAMTARWSGAS